MSDITLEEIVKYIDWSPFFGLGAQNYLPKYIKVEKWGEQASKLFDEASVIRKNY